MKTRVVQGFERSFGALPAFVVRAPGRVNLIGEHTDYNDGFVMPMAIDRAVWIALRPRGDQRIRVLSLDMDETLEFSLTKMPAERTGWGDYLIGVAWALTEAGYSLMGWDGALAGDVPIGAGLSSSAALELATARAFAASSGFAWDAVTMARIAQRAENKWVGVNCGLMDQLISAAGRAGHALLIDIRNVEMCSVPIPSDAGVVILDTSTRRGLVDSVYNERRAQCEAAASHFGVPALRDVTAVQVEAQADGLADVTRRRARHVVTENMRTLQAAEAMRRGDAVELGALMNASHISLRDDFDVSSSELNAIVESAQAEEACYGARMTGAGLGGCAVALVRSDRINRFVARVCHNYAQDTGLVPNLYVCAATNGAQVETAG